MEIDVGRVTPLLLANGTLSAQQALAQPQLEQFSHGQSNPTYKLTFGAVQLVLRKQPPGKLLRGAHAVDREEKVMSALAHPDSRVPVPKTRLYCEDTEVIGTPFIVQDFADGRLFRDAAMADASSPKERAELYGAFLQACAAIHAVDYEKIGLGDFGKVGGYISRQIKVWTSQYRASETEAIPSMERLMAWLPEALPPDDDMTKLVHGDLRVDNMIFAKHKSEVIAVLDWELSTLGHPAADVALATLGYVAPSSLPPQFTLGVSNPREIGIPLEQDFVDGYVDLTGYKSVRTHMDYYRAFVCFRMASILQGVYKRALSGQASAPNAEKVGKMASVLADVGNEAAATYTSSPDRLTRTAGSGAAFFTATMRSRARGRCESLRLSIRDFVETKLLPIESELFTRSYDAPERWTSAPQLEALKSEAKQAGLWNLFLPSESGLSNRDYATLAEEMGRCLWAPEVFNCNAPDTGNMEVLHMFGTPAQQERWLQPLLDGEIRSCFAMTEPDVASSDATNMQATVRIDGDHLVLNGRKWWITGAGNPDCKICIFLGRAIELENDSQPRHAHHSMVLVPMDTPGLKVVRPLKALGFEDPPHGHCELDFDNVRVPAENILLGHGRGFEIAQARLGPGRIHHCMRLIGMAERALELAIGRAEARIAFGKPLSAQGTVQQSIAASRIEIEQARLLTLHCAQKIDELGAKAARNEIAMIKVTAPSMAQAVIDRCMQIHGAKGLSADVPLAHMFMWARALRLADGPDEVHAMSIAKAELKAHRSRSPSHL